MYQTEGCIIINRPFEKVSALMITYVGYKEDSVRHAELIYGTEVLSGEVSNYREVYYKKGIISVLNRLQHL